MHHAFAHFTAIIDIWSLPSTNRAELGMLSFGLPANATTLSGWAFAAAAASQSAPLAGAIPALHSPAPTSGVAPTEATATFTASSPVGLPCRRKRQFSP